MIWRTDELNPSWPVAPLASLASKVGSGATPRGGRAAYPERGVPLIRSQNIHFDGFNATGLAFLNDAQAQQLAGATVAADDVLLNITGASIGRVCKAPSQIAGARVNQHVCIIRPSKIRPSFLANYLASPQVQDAISLGNYGVTREALTKFQILQLPVPVPAIEVQDALVAQITKINNHRISTAIHLANALRAIERFRQSVLAAACSGAITAAWREANQIEPPDLHAPLKNRPKRLRVIDSYELGNLPSSWIWAQVDDLLPAGGIFDGPFGSNLKTADYTAIGARVIRLENIGHLEFIGRKQTFVSTEKYRTLTKHAVHPGDIVFSSFVEEQIRVCVLPRDLEPMAIAKADCFTLRPREIIYQPYLALQLASPASYRNLVADVHGATRPRVNTSQLRSLPIPVCPMAEQQEIVRRFRALTAAADDLTYRIKVASIALGHSSKATLAKAFRGELVSPEACDN